MKVLRVIGLGLTAEQQDAIYALGFHKFWTHSTGKGERDPQETLNADTAATTKRQVNWMAAQCTFAFFSGCAQAQLRWEVVRKSIIGVPATTFHGTVGPFQIIEKWA